MADWERLESQLRDLEQTAAGWVQDPLDPADIRRLGVRRQRRRWAATAVLAACLLVVGAAGVFGVGMLPQQQREPSPAGSPTVSSSPSVTEPAPTPEPGQGGSAEGRILPRTTRPVLPPSSTYAPSSPTPTGVTPTPDEPSASPTEDETSTTEPEPNETGEPEPTAGPGDDGADGADGGDDSEGNGGGGNGGAGESTEQAPQPPGDTGAG